MTVAALACPACGAGIQLRAAGQTLSLVCGNCGSTLDASTPELKVIAESHRALARPEIALGTRATLDGVAWETVGYLERSAGGEGWREYLLFNPYEGFRFLVDTDGEFWLGEMLDRQPEAEGRRAMLHGRSWYGRSRYDARVDFVVGEFWWRVAVGDTVAVAEYDGEVMGAPARLVREAGGGQGEGGEAGWTLLRRQPAGSIEAAFGIAARQPPAPPLDSLWWRHTVIAGIAAAAVLFIAILAPPSRRVATATIDVPVNGPGVTATIGPIILSGRRVGVAVAAATRLDNQSVDLDYELVDRRTQATYSVGTVAEYYTGYDADGAWAEGDSRPETTMASIPGGTYDLVVEASAASWPAPPPSDTPPPVAVTVPVAVSLEANTFFLSNLVLAMIALFAWPLILLSIHSNKTEEDEW